MDECIELQIMESETRAIAEAQRAIAACLARVARAVDAAKPGGADGLLAVVASGQGTIVAQMDIAPAGSISIYLLHGDRKHNLGMLICKPPARQQH